MSEVRYYWIDSKPVSLNHAYITNRWKLTKYKSPDARKLQSDVISSLTKKDDETYKSKFDCSSQFDFIYYFFYPPKSLYLKSGGLRKSFDITNLFKMVEDSVMEYLDANDTFVLNVSGHKRESWDEEYHILVLLSPYNNLLSYIDFISENIVVDRPGRLSVISVV